jgi:hypothetical protein
VFFVADDAGPRGYTAEHGYLTIQVGEGYPRLTCLLK